MVLSNIMKRRYACLLELTKMAMAKKWNKGEHDAFVSIGERQLYCSMLVD